MDYVCIVLGILFMAGGIIFTFDKVYVHISAWQKMSDEEKNKIKIKSLCQNIGAMITLNGILFVLKGCLAGFSDQMFSIAIIIWLVIAGFDVYYISKSNRYRNQ